MAKVEIIAKLKQKNDADFKIADAKDIEMEDGSDLQSTIDNMKKNDTNIDMEKYATKEELETKADKEHTHDYNDITNPPTIPSIEGLATEEYVDTAIENAQLSGGKIDTSNFATKEELETKADKEHTHSYTDLTDKPLIPSIEGLATEDYVKNEIANAQLGGGEVDLSGYATKEELSTKVDKLEGYSLISDSEITRLSKVNNYDDTNIKSTLDSKANKTDLHSHDNKKVLDEITNEKISNWNNKAERTHTHSYADLTDKPIIPSLDGYATETFVTNKIAEAQLGSGGDIDLSGYATKDELNTKVDKIEGYSLISDSEITRLSKVNNYDDTEIKNSLNSKANKTDLHSHSNKNVLDGITSTEVENWNNKSEFSGDYNDLINKPTLHSHSNKTILDNITASKVSSWDSKSDFSGSYNDLTDTPSIPTKTSDLINDSNFVNSSDLNKKADKTELHSHINKTILDNISSDDIDNWNSKTSFDGNYNSLTNKPTIPTKTSDLINDNKFVNTTQLNTKVDKKTGYSLVADSEIERLANVDNYDDTEIKNELNNKSDLGHTHNYNDLTNKPTIPSIDGLATETFVTNKIAEAQLSQGKIDLTGYATKDDLKTKADKTELHEHSNKTVLDGITSDKVTSWDNKSDFSGDYNDLTNKPALHSHSNKNTLDTISDEKITEWDNKSDFSGSYNDLTNKPTIPTKTSQLKNDSGYVTSTSLHSHANKAVLDKITANKVTSWDNKSDFSGDYNDLTNKPTIPTVDVNKSYVDTALSKKVDKKTGYSLVADSEIERLANVDNYNDTEIKNELSKKANSSDLHSHSNKKVLDGITAEKVEEWDVKSTFSGNYNDLTNKPTIPTKTSQLKNDSNYATVSQLHSHTNKTILDDISETDITNWNNKSNFSGSYNDLTDKPNIPTVDVNKSYVDSKLNTKVDKKTGYSLVADSEIERLANVDNYDDTSIKASINTKANSSDVYTKTQTNNLLNAKANKTDLHSHSNKTVLDTITEEKLAEWDNKSSFSGNYNDLTNKPTIPKVDSVLSSTSINAIQNKVVKSALDSKANSSHIHSISDVTNLQDSLDSKSDKGHTHSYDDLTNKPTIPTVTNDLTNELKNKYDTAYTHSQSAHAPSNAEKNVQSDWNVIDTTSDAYIKNKPSIHSHTNKTVLDGITADKVVSWDNKSEFSGSYNDLVDKPTIPTKTSQLTNDSNFVTTSTLNTELNKKANASHNHTISDITNLQTTLDGKSDTGHTHDYSELNNLPTIPVVDSVLSTTSTNAIQNKAVTTALNKKADSSHNHSYNDLSDKPIIPIVDSVLSTTSTNAIQNKVVTNALNNKSDKKHTHAISEITNLQTTLDGKSDTGHTHNYAGSSSAGGDATNALACSGNSATASKLQTARTINGTSFDGNADITTSQWGTARNITIGKTTKSVNGSANISWSLEEIGTTQIIKSVSTVAELKSALTQGGRIHVQGGEYILGENEELEYYSNTELIGVGDVTIKVNSSSAGYIALKPHLNGTEGGYTGVHNFTMENINMDGQAGTNNYGLFATAHCKNIEIRNCTFKNYCGRWHLVEINSSQNVKMVNCDITDYNYNLDSTEMFCTEALQIDFAGDQGNYPFTCKLDNTGCQNITFESCNFERIKTSWTACVGSHTISADYMPRNVTFTRCTFTDVDNCIYAPDFKNLVCDTCTAKNVANFVIMHPSANQNGTSCKIDNCEYDGWGRSKTISYMNNTAEGRFFFQLGAEYELSASKLTNNTINNAYSHAIGISPNCATIIGNSVKFSGKHGIYLYGGSQTTITGNSAVGNGTLSGYTGRDIYISCGALGYVKRSNISNNSAYVYTSGETFEGTKIQDNL